MKRSRIAYYVITGMLIMLSFSNLFENRAFEFSKHVTERNLEFLEVVAGVKLVVAGMSDIDVPFISGHATDLTKSLDKTQDYLLKSNTISFVQLMVISISKSWPVKFVLLGLFVLSLFPGARVYFSKLMVLGLILVPGLSIFTVGVQTLAKHSSIDFGDKYITELQANVKAIKTEHSKLMQEHAKQKTEIQNENFSGGIFKKFKEDVSYDSKSAVSAIHGDFAHIRLLIHEAGHSMVSKISNFCTMIIFCLILMPLGYAFICYITYKHLFNKLNLKGLAVEGKTAMNQVDHDLESKSFITKLKKAFIAGRKEFSLDEKGLEKSKLLQEASADLDKLKDKVESVSHIDVKGIKSDVESDYTKIKGLVEKAVEDKVTSIYSQIKAKVHIEEKAVKQVADKELSSTEGNIRDISTVVDHVEADVKNKIAATNYEIKSKITGVENKVKESIESNFSAVEDKVGDKIKDDVKSVKSDKKDKPKSIISI